MKSSPPESTRNNPAKAEQVLVLPGSLFYIETVKVPNELEASEISDFAELSLESIAPFPIDYLCWGYLYHKGAPSLILYAAHRERIKKEGFADLDDYAWVVPDFATLSGANFNEDTLVLLEGENSISLMHFEKAAELPRSIWVDASVNPVTEEAVELFKADILDLPKTAPTLQLRPMVTTVNEKGLPTFEHNTAEQTESRHYDGNWQTLAPTESQLWQMDVRAVDFKIAEKSKRHTSALVFRLTGWAAAFALILILTEGLLFAAQNWLNNQLATIEGQRVAVSKVEEKQILVNKLEQVAQNELRPIEMLEAANNIRLELNLGIEYDEVVIEDENHLTIEGKASSISALNRYADSLKTSGRFELLDKPDPSTRNGKTTFRVKLAFRPETTPAEIVPPEKAPAAVENDATTEISKHGKEAKTG